MYFLNSQRTIISGALFIAFVLIVGAYILSGRHITTPTVSAESTDALLKAYAAKDSDNDGLPDWEEALYGTDPNNAHSVRANLTDGDAVAQGLATPHYSGQPVAATASSSINLAAQVPGPSAAPGSLTDQFSKIFFNSYMAARGDAKPSATQMQTFVQSAISDLVSTRVRATAFSASDMKVSGSGGAALKVYAAGVDAAFLQNSVNLPYSEAVYFSDAVKKNDATALKNITAIAKSYAAVATTIAKIPVPQEAATAHLALVNAMATLGNTVTDLSSLNDDPIRSMLGMGEYPGDLNSFMISLRTMKSVFDAAQVTIAPNEAGHSFLHLMSVAATSPSPVKNP